MNGDWANEAGSGDWAGEAGPPDRQGSGKKRDWTALLLRVLPIIASAGAGAAAGGRHGFAGAVRGYNAETDRQADRSTKAAAAALRMLQREDENRRHTETQEGYDRRSQEQIAASNARSAANNASREKVAADRIKAGQKAPEPGLILDSTTRSLTEEPAIESALTDALGPAKMAPGKQRYSPSNRQAAIQEQQRLQDENKPKPAKGLQHVTTAKGIFTFDPETGKLGERLGDPHQTDPKGAYQALTDDFGVVQGFFNPANKDFVPSPMVGARKGPLSPTDRDKNAGFRLLLDQSHQLEDLAKKYGGHIGVVRGPLTDAQRRTMGVGDDINDMFRIAAGAREELLRLKSGAAINESEYKRISDLVPNPASNVKKFWSDLRIYRQELKARYEDRSGKKYEREGATPTQGTTSSGLKYEIVK